MPRFLTMAEIVGQTEITDDQAAENRRSGRRPTRARPAIRGRIPISRTTWEEGVRDGRFPQPRWINRQRVWLEDEIAQLEQRIADGDPSLRTVSPQVVATRVAHARDARSRYAFERRMARDAVEAAE